MRRFERQGKDKISAALDKLRKRLFSGLSDRTINQIITRMNDREVMQPFRDSLTAVVSEWALAGAAFGQEQIERNVFGTAKQLSDGLSVDWALANEAAARWSSQYTFELVSGIEETTRRRLQQEISGFADSGETFQQFSRRMAAGDIFSPVRSEMIAVTEVTRAFAQGNIAAWRESGVTQGKEWNTANDELVCPICGPLDGEEVGLDEKFPGNLEGPPAHPRCRCWVTPVAIGDTASDLLRRPGREL
jgi:SPP1 gp7 family putative phage head morphogenesis protein